MTGPFKEFYSCPNCGKTICEEKKMYFVCPNCGRALCAIRGSKSQGKWRFSGRFSNLIKILNLADGDYGMSYAKLMYRSENAIDVSEYHTGRYGAPGQKRQKKKKATPEQIERQNQYLRERNVKWKLWDHFDVNDYFSTWTYRKDARPPDMETAKKDFKKAIEKDFNFSASASGV